MYKHILQYNYGTIEISWSSLDNVACDMWYDYPKKHFVIILKWVRNEGASVAITKAYADKHNLGQMLSAS